MADEYVRIKRRLLADLMTGKDVWMIRALLLSRRLEERGYEAEDVMEADKDRLALLVEKELYRRDG